MEELDNITRRRPLKKCKSLEKMDMSTSINSSYSDEILSRRLDVSSQITALCRDEMDSEINKLKADLQFAQDKLENVILENVEQKKQIDQLSQEVEILKQICRSPRTTLRQPTMQKSKVKRRLTESFRNSPLMRQSSPNGEKLDAHTHSLAQQEKPQSNIPTTELGCSEQSVSELVFHPQSRQSLDCSIEIPCAQTSLALPNKSDYQLSQNSDVYNTTDVPKIIILGDQQVRGFASLIKLQRDANKWNNVYSVSGVSKPNATSTQILYEIDDYIKTLHTDDIVILGIGSNDKNPYKFLSELIPTLHKLRNNQVFILNIINNPYLNVNLLNQNIKLFLLNFPNCKFIDTTENIYSHNNYNYTFKEILCYKLNIEIDNINLKKTLDTACTLRHSRTSSSSNINSSKCVNTKGTIPYYFKVQIKNTHQPLHTTTTTPNPNAIKSTFFRG